MKGFIALLFLPLMVLNFFGGFVGGVWLAFLGNWSIIFSGLLYGFVAVFAISLFLMLGMLIGAPGVMLAQRHPTLGAIVAIPAMIWTYLVMAVTCVGIFFFFMRGSYGQPVPHLLWAYSSAIGPWAYLASKEPPGGSEGLSLFFAQLGAVAMGIAVLTDPYDISVERLAWWFVPFLAAGAVLQAFLVVGVAIEEGRRETFEGNF